MGKDTIDGKTSVQPANSASDENLRTPVTILFSDIKGSTTYFERKGDVEGLAMVQRSQALLIPCVEGNSGRIVKTIGDGVMALFDDPRDAVLAAVGMQEALVEDGKTLPESEQIHIRIGIHTGLGLIRDNDVFGDVVNAASRVQSQAAPDEILITDNLVSAAAASGLPAVRRGLAKLQGKDEQIEIYALGWSAPATQRLIDGQQDGFEDELLTLRQARSNVEDEFDKARQEWREARRKLHAEIERLEQGSRDALETARSEHSEEFKKQAEFKVAAAEKAKQQLEEDLRSTRERIETERVGYKAQIDSLETRLVQAIEYVNSPSRIANEVREEVDARLGRAKKQWNEQWETERKRLNSEIEQLKASLRQNPMAEARRQMIERIKSRSSAEEEEDPSDARERLELEREELEARIESLEAELVGTAERARREVYQELRHRYVQKIEQAERIRVQIELELNTVKEELRSEKQSLDSRIHQLEDTVSEAQEAARVQAEAEIRAEYEDKLDEADRLRALLERRHQVEVDDWDLERSRLLKELDELRSSLDQAHETASKRSSDPTIEELNRLRRELEDEFQSRVADWEKEKRSVAEKIDMSNRS